MTTNLLCGSSKDIVKNSIVKQKAFVVNALSQEYHSKLSIPGTCSLGHQRIASMTPGRICSEVKQNMNRQVPQLMRYAKQNNIRFSDLPIILYCAHKGCMAAKRLASHFIKVGFTNLYYYAEGLHGWYGADTLRDAFST